MDIPVGSLRFKGPAVPAVGGDTSIPITAGMLRLRGPAGTQAGILIATVALSLSGTAPILAVNPSGGASIAVPAGSLQVSGQFVAVKFEGPQPAPLIFVGRVPMLSIGVGSTGAVSVPTGSLAFAGTFVDTAYLGSATGQLTISGRVPSLILNSVLRNPFAGTLSLTGRTPLAQVVGTAPVIHVPVRALVLSGLAPQSSTNLYTFTIAGVSVNIRAETLRIAETMNGRNTLSVEVVSAPGTYRPLVGSEIIFTEDGVRIFGGFIDIPSESGLSPYGGSAITTRVQAVDFNALADRRVVSITQNEASLHSWLTLLTPFLAGVSLDGAQPTGPTLPRIEFVNRSVRDALEELSLITASVTNTSWSWEIDYSKVLRMREVGTMSAPFNVVPGIDTNALGDITVEPSRVDYANRILLDAGSGTQLVTETFVGNGSQIVFPLTRRISGFPNPVKVNGDIVNVDEYVASGSLFKWAYRASDNAIVMHTEAPPGTFHAPLGSGETLEVTYTGQYPIRYQADDVVEQGMHGIVERVIAAPDVFDPVMAQALADGYLTRSVVSYKTVRYATFRKAVHPGQTQSILVNDRNLTGTFLVTDVAIYETRNRLIRSVTAVSGTKYPGSWRDTFRQLTRGGGSSGSTTVSGVPVLASGGLFDGNLVANRNGDGTNQRFESSLQFSSRSATGGPALVLGKIDDTNRWAIIADYIRNSGALDPGLVLACGSHPLDAVHFRIYDTNKIALCALNGSTTFILGAKSTHGLGTFGSEIAEVNTNNLDTFNGLTERGRLVKMGEPNTRPVYSASNYTGSSGSSSDWAVAAGDINDESWSEVGKKISYHFMFSTTTVANTPDHLRIVLPSGYIVSRHAWNPISAYSAGLGTPQITTAYVVAEPGAALLRLYRDIAHTPWSNESDGLSVYGQITFFIV